jgi:two-component system, response regulator PhcR
MPLFLDYFLKLTLLYFIKIPHLNTTDNQPQVLYVDDEDNNLSAFRAAFRRYFTIFTANSAVEARKILENNTIHVLISDQKMPGTPGVELLGQALQKYPDQVRILLTAYSDFEVLKQAVNDGYIFKFLAKPWNDDDLKLVISQAYDLYFKNLEKKSQIEKAEAKKKYLEEEIKKLEEILKIKKDEIDKFIDNA